MKRRHPPTKNDEKRASISRRCVLSSSLLVVLLINSAQISFAGGAGDAIRVLLPTDGWFITSLRLYVVKQVISVAVCDVLMLLSCRLKERLY